jgi:hypothetical protein
MLTVAVIVNVAFAPLAKLPMVQFGAVHVPTEVLRSQMCNLLVLHLQY